MARDMSIHCAESGLPKAGLNGNARVYRHLVMQIDM